MSTARVPLKDAMLPRGGLRWRSFGAGAFVQIVLLVVLVMIPLLFPDSVSQFHRYLITEMAPPALVRVRKPRTRSRPRPLLASKTKLTRFPISHPNIPSPVPSMPRPKHASGILTPEAPKIPVRPQIPIELSPSAIPHLQRPREPVRMGGFDETSGSTAAKASSKSYVTQVGDFNAHAGSGGSGRRGRGAVQVGLFAAEETGGSARQPTKIAAASLLATPVEILFKPTPKYTQIAVAKKIEGEVVLQVSFSAVGEVKVLRVIRGLGYGLNETAEDAARQIKFRPAKNGDGEPIDSIATVHIVFELAF